MAKKKLGFGNSWGAVLKGKMNQMVQEDPDSSLPPYEMPFLRMSDGRNAYMANLLPYLMAIYDTEKVFEDGFIDLASLYKETDDANLVKIYKTTNPANGVNLFEQTPDPLCGRMVYAAVFNIRDGEFVEYDFKTKAFLPSKMTKSGKYLKTPARIAIGKNKELGYEEPKKEVATNNNSANIFGDPLTEEEPLDDASEDEIEEMNYQKMKVYFPVEKVDKLKEYIQLFTENEKPNFRKEAYQEALNEGFTEAQRETKEFTDRFEKLIEDQKHKWESSYETMQLFIVADKPQKHPYKIGDKSGFWWKMDAYDAFFLTE